jgi:hypothetical protein
MSEKRKKLGTTSVCNTDKKKERKRYAHWAERKPGELRCENQ